jgi:hypothetical protein
MDVLARNHNLAVTRMRFYRLHLHLKFRGQPFVVIVEQSDPWRTGLAYTDIPRFGATNLPADWNAANPRIGQARKGADARAFLLSIDHHDDFDFSQRLFKRAPHCLQQKCRPIVSGYHHAYKWIGLIHVIVRGKRNCRETRTQGTA